MDLKELNGPKRIAVTVFWIWGAIGALLFFYAGYHYLFLPQQEYFRLLVIGIAVMFTGNLFAFVVGKLLNRNHAGQ